MGVFVPVSHLDNISFLGMTFSGAQQLFLLGGIAIAVGVFTFSKRVMLTVGKGIFDLSPVMAAVVVWSHSLVLVLFSSQALESWLKGHNLPAFPLVPVSSSQAIVGAVIGIGLLKGGKAIRWKTVAGITSGWITTPILAAVISLLSLFFLQNVFQQDTFKNVEFILDNDAAAHIQQLGIDPAPLQPLMWQEFPNAVAFKKKLEATVVLDRKFLQQVLAAARIDNLEITAESLKQIKPQSMNTAQLKAVQPLTGRVFTHNWQLAEALAEQSPEFRLHGGDPERNIQIQSILQQLYNQFRI